MLNKIAGASSASQMGNEQLDKAVRSIVLLSARQRTARDNVSFDRMDVEWYLDNLNCIGHKR